MVDEPLPAATSRGLSAPYEGRWRWWYSAIADWMLEHPGRPMTECAAYLKKAPSTVYAITASDTFREYFARRRSEWSQTHDQVLTQKLTSVTELALDSLLGQLEKKRDQIPMNIVKDLAVSGLDRLGFGPKTTPAVNVNVQQNDNRQQIAIAVTASDLEEARIALRRVEQRRSEEPPATVPLASSAARNSSSSLVGDGRVEAEEFRGRGSEPSGKVVHDDPLSLDS
jgi:hypothetical protein